MTWILILSLQERETCYLKHLFWGAPLLRNTTAEDYAPYNLRLGYQCLVVVTGLMSRLVLYHLRVFSLYLLIL